MGAGAAFVVFAALAAAAVVAVAVGSWWPLIWTVAGIVVAEVALLVGVAWSARRRP